MRVKGTRKCNCNKKEIEKRIMKDIMKDKKKRSKETKFRKWTVERILLTFMFERSQATDTDSGDDQPVLYLASDRLDTEFVESVLRDSPRVSTKTDGGWCEKTSQMCKSRIYASRRTHITVLCKYWSVYIGSFWNQFESFLSSRVRSTLMLFAFHHESLYF